MTGNRAKIIIVGDLFPVPSNSEKFSRGDVEYLFGERICQLFFDSDYRICNLEGALTDYPGQCEKTGPSVFAPTSTICGFKKLRIDCCTLANNHITDAGDQGVKDTIKTLVEEGIGFLGAGDNEDRIIHYHFFIVVDKRICLYNVAETMYNAPQKNKPGAYLYDEYIVCNELKTLRKQCDYLIVIYHGGVEKYRYPSPQTRERFHRMVDSGANMILSQHTHCVGSEEYYNGAYLLYGQGNFLFRSFNNEFTDTGLIIELDIDGDSFTVKKHIVNAVNDTVRYDDYQDFSSFNERSIQVQDEEFLQEQFEKYCLNELPVYLRAYKGKTFCGKFVRRLLPRVYKHIYMTDYKREQLLFTLHSLRSEQNREVAIKGLEVYLRSFGK